MLSMCDNVLAQMLPGEAIALNNDFEKRVASTLPDETLFLHAYAGAASIKEVKDGRLLNIVGRLEKQVSEDGGETWTESAPLTDGSGNQIVGSAANLVVLKSGALGLIYAFTREGDKGRPAWFIRSDDEGETWSDPVMVSEPGIMAAIWNDTAIVTSSGRIVIPVYWYVGKRVIIPQGVGASVGLLGDELAGVGGHGYENIIDVSWVYYSDDEGRTWQRNEDGEMMVTIDYSAGGHFSCEESVIAEVSPNHLLNVHRTQLGRLYQSWSDDDGSTWSHPEPTTLASSRAPACLRRVPGTDDLLILWNQVSGDEIERGRQRHRLTAAISQDGGATWKFRKNVGALDGDETTYVEPPPIRSYRAANYTPRLPYNDRVMDYPSMYIGKDRVIINTKFKERGPDIDLPPRGKGVRTTITLGLPLQWFYEG